MSSGIISSILTCRFGFLAGNEERSARKCASNTLSNVGQIIDNQELVPYAQTIRDLKSHTQYGYEMLIRGPLNSELHRADLLFHSASEHGLGDALEIACLTTHLTTIANSHIATSYSVNLSPKLLFDHEVETLLKNHPLPNQTKLELTEHLHVENWDPIKQRMDEFRRFGYEFWLDDVGCGFFDLKLIDEVQPEVVKLCIKIVSQLPSNQAIKQDIQAVVEQVHSYGGKVLAEGVENEAQLDVANSLGIDYAQGYLFDKPTQFTN